MQIRQEVKLSAEEISNLLKEHLARKGYRINSCIFDKNCNATLYTMTEAEIYYVDTTKILESSLSLLNLNNRKLERKLLDELGENATVAVLLNTKLEKAQEYQRSGLQEEYIAKFKKETKLSLKLNTKPFTKNDRDLLIKTLADLGIIVNN